MTSKSRSAYKFARSRTLRLLQIATDRRLRPVTYKDSEPALHAALASLVSSWEAYIESVVLEAIDATLPSASPEVMFFALLHKAEATRAIAKFNTPNAENCRDLVLRYTGYDAFPEFSSPKLGLSALPARSRLNEILRVRHAFAHGFPIPRYVWTTRYRIENRLTKKSVNESVSLIDDFVSSLDQAIASHMRLSFPTANYW